MNKKVKGIYIHIPFCKDICYYCDFARIYYNEKIADEYLDVLIEEYNSENIICNDIESIYIGGGTPSSLNENQLERLLIEIDYKRFKNLKEFTIEINPENINEEKIIILKKYGINRISVGVQTFDDTRLKEINRQHNKDDIVKIIKLLKKYDFNNISIDLMYNFANQTKEQLLSDLNSLMILNINHVSVYSLILEEGTIFYKNKYQSEDNDELDLLINTYLNEYGYEHYEVSNYAKNNSYSIHNLLYWNNEYYYGFGLGAAGYLNNYRYYNTKSITNYLKKDNKKRVEYYNNSYELLKDEIMLKFRIFNGIDIGKIEDKYAIEFTKLFEHAIINNKTRVYIENNKLYFTNEGKLFLNDVIIDFINEIEE
ncbi:oxygen-independent coproporphyrinogen-3 oxidase [Bacilli bacterium PM5-9]|nr:oxygen-independent coproporphyrinogen-3 oxidase [Bacilli bacterium PM5-9]